ncbi:MAG TPA: pyridoxamine 5'-phosphate oxidase family protein [Ktedonobacterales bacterium]|nr:pyridoxamine 5'-phosphate oxidase family protein [Ktedonobacterales bacterium]
MLGTLNRQQIDQVLRGAVIGRIGCLAGDRVYLVPITYACDGEYVYGHSADGMKLRALRSHPSVCFEVELVEDLAHWQRVIAWGTFEELQGAAAEAGMRVLMDRLMPLMVSETSTGQATGPHPHAEQAQTAGAGAGRQATVYRIRLGERTGHFEKH